MRQLYGMFSTVVHNFHILSNVSDLEIVWVGVPLLGGKLRKVVGVLVMRKNEKFYSPTRSASSVFSVLPIGSSFSSGHWK